MEVSSRPRISAVVLAAGRSVRFGPENKLLSLVGGEPLLRRVVQVVVSARFDETIVVTGHENLQLERALSGLPVCCVFNPDYDKGPGGSVSSGVRACDPLSDGLLIVLGDNAGLTHGSLANLRDKFRSPDDIVVSEFSGHRGSPVLFGSTYRPQLESLEGCQMPKLIWETRHESVIYCHQSLGVERDIDVAEDLRDI